MATSEKTLMKVGTYIESHYGDWINDPGCHLTERHVNLSDTDLEERLKYKNMVSTFLGEPETIQEFVKDSLFSSIEDIVDWIFRSKGKNCLYVSGELPSYISGKAMDRSGMSYTCFGYCICLQKEVFEKEGKKRLRFRLKSAWPEFQVRSKPTSVRD